MKEFVAVWLVDWLIDWTAEEFLDSLELFRKFLLIFLKHVLDGSDRWSSHHGALDVRIWPILPEDRADILRMALIVGIGLPGETPLGFLRPHAESFQHVDGGLFEVHGVKVEAWSAARVQHLAAELGRHFDAIVAHRLVVVFHRLQGVQYLLRHIRLGQIRDRSKGSITLRIKMKKNHVCFERGGGEKMADELLSYPVLLSHFSPAPVKTDRTVRIHQTNQVKVIIKVHNETLRLIDWFCTIPGKLP